MAPINTEPNPDEEGAFSSRPRTFSSESFAKCQNETVEHVGYLERETRRKKEQLLLLKERALSNLDAFVDDVYNLEKQVEALKKQVEVLEDEYAFVTR